MKNGDPDRTSHADDLARLEAIEGAVKELFALPNWSRRCGSWLDIHNKLAALHVALTGKEPE